ncbi:hypothetical protein NM208_g12894 [Fusarium decemcellulare]|uniref:Uncharacterized protein n=1 Tax=Fusarium decemcellulare TaxID=57161 RepID=A0ACC1RQF4_9HYPO|nr:hypothetical protein NM208_g12894 [Fusarium decemcellulare]
MDPAWIKTRRRQKKADPTIPSGQFRKKLSNNPYFFQDFELVQHPDPEDEDAWIVPGPLSFEHVMPSQGPFRKPRSKSNTNPESETSESETTTELSNSTEESSSAAEAVDTAATTSPAQLKAVKDTLEKEQRPYRAPIVAYVISRKEVLDFLGTRQGSKLRGKVFCQTSGTRATLRNFQVWPVNTGEILLKLLRKKAVDALIHRANKSRGPQFRFVQPFTNWDEVKKETNQGCVLWLPTESKGAEAAYATLDREGANWGNKAPVHDLFYLLGEEEVQRLREGAEMFRDQEILLLKDWRSVSSRNLHMLLWRLQGYLATPTVQPREEEPEITEAPLDQPEGDTTTRGEYVPLS